MSDQTLKITVHIEAEPDTINKIELKLATSVTGVRRGIAQLVKEKLQAVGIVDPFTVTCALADQENINTSSGGLSANEWMDK